MRPKFHVDTLYTHINTHTHTHTLPLISEHRQRCYALFRVSFCGTIKQRSLWPPRSPNLNTRGCYLRSNVQDKIYRNNHRTEDDRKKSNQDVVSSVSPAEIQRAMNNAFVKCDPQVRAEGNHFQQRLFFFFFFLFFFFWRYTIHSGCVFYSPLSGFSLPAYEVT